MAIHREGFEHTMALMTKERDCLKITAFEPRFGCTWSTDPLPEEVGGALQKAADLAACLDL